MMKKLAILIAFAWSLTGMTVAIADFHGSARVNLDDRASLHRGAQLFVNYCMGCHAAQYHRWTHVSNDLGIPENVVQEQLIWTSDLQGQKTGVGELMTIAMTEAYGERVYGQTPPDLTLTTRYRSPDWVYNFLRGFYLSEESPTGVDNMMLSGAAMPHVLWQMQGFQKAVHDEDGDITGLDIAIEGSMSPSEYDRAVNDVVTFMAYLAEPAAMKRTKIGAWVMLFLVIFTFLAYLLKKEYWKDIH